MKLLWGLRSDPSSAVIWTGPTKTHKLSHGLHCGLVLYVQEVFVQSLLLLSECLVFPLTSLPLPQRQQHTDLGVLGDQESHFDLRNRRETIIRRPSIGQDN